MINLAEAIAFHEQNLGNIDGDCDAKKQAFYRQVLRLYLMLRELGIEANKIKSAQFKDTPGIAQAPSVNFKVDGISFDFFIVNDVLQLRNSGQTQLFGFPSESIGCAVNLATNIVHKACIQKARAIA
ncbi:hypothetical protein [Nostoc sp. FACHB-190]|uniref:hypothetical protein n=1 Tax=Nostoc sp. FACHB-190 TaxID=2692838 RepID=UPI0016889CC9|nr:hypothetical protein [Nostoc sp. FACHB-190]MBD2298941.1 hypothetical protein [Nostoc sp. FACHB-190]